MAINWKKFIHTGILIVCGSALTFGCLNIKIPLKQKINLEYELEKPGTVKPGIPAKTQEVNFEYFIETGDRLLKKAEDLGILTETKKRNFVNDLVWDQSNHPNNPRFFKRIGEDVIWVDENGQVRYAKNVDKTYGDISWVDDRFVLSQEMMEKHNISEEKAALAGFNLVGAKTQARSKEIQPEKTEKDNLENEIKSGYSKKTYNYYLIANHGNPDTLEKNIDSSQNIFRQYVGTKIKFVHPKAYDIDDLLSGFDITIANVVKAYNSGINAGVIANQSDEAFLQNADDVCQTLAFARKQGYLFNRKIFNFKVAAMSNDISIIIDGYNAGKTYKVIREEFENQTGMGVSDSSIYRVVKKGKDKGQIQSS